MNPPGDGQLTLRIARSISEIEEIRDIWVEWQSSPTSDIDDFLTMVRLKPEIQRPHVMLVYRGEHLDSILIGRLERTRIKFTLGYLKLFQPEVRVLCFAYRGFLGNQSSENGEFLTREIMKCLGCGEADMARLDYVGTDSSLFGAAKGIPGILCRDHFAPTQPHGCLRLPDCFEEFFGSLSRKERHNLKRYEGRVKADYPKQIRIQSFRKHDQVEGLIRDTEIVAKKTYQRALGVGFQDNLETRQSLLTAAQKGSLRGCILYLKDLPCAFMIGVQYRQALHGICMGYDPQFTEYSPGSLLLMHWIREAFEPNGLQRITEVDLGPGDGRYKRALHNHMWHESVVYIFAPNLKGLMFNTQRTLAYLMDQSARKLFVNTGFLEKIKKVWRSRAMSSDQLEDTHGVEDVPYSNSAQSHD